MFDSARCSFTTRVKDDPLLPSIERLRRALASRASGQRWVKALGGALARTEHALRHHLDLSEAPDGPLAEVRLTQPPLTRQTAFVARRFRSLLENSTALQREIHRAAKMGNGVVDVEKIRRRAERFLAGCQQAREAETVLLLDSINMDIGVGD